MVMSQHPQGSLQHAYAFCTWPELQRARIIVNNTLPLLIEEETETWRGEMLTGWSSISSSVHFAYPTWGSPTTMEPCS